VPIPNCFNVLPDESGDIDPHVKTREIKVECHDGENPFDENEEETDLEWRTKDAKLKTKQTKTNREQIENKSKINR
jgi:hypothetical protein